MKCSECNKKATTMIEGTYYCDKHKYIEVDFDKPNFLCDMVILEPSRKTLKEIEKSKKLKDRWMRRNKNRI